MKLAKLASAISIRPADVMFAGCYCYLMLAGIHASLSSTREYIVHCALSAWYVLRDQVAEVLLPAECQVGEWLEERAVCNHLS